MQYENIKIFIIRSYKLKALNLSFLQKTLRNNGGE